MRDDDGVPPTTLLRSGPPAGPRSAGLAVVLPPPAATVVDLDARRARGAVVDITTAERGGAAPQRPLLVSTEPSGGVRPVRDESHLSIQDRIRLRALEAARP